MKIAIKESSRELMLNLFHHRWSLPVITELADLDGAKFVSLVNKLDVSRDSLNRTLKALVDSSWVQKNPGYGHPLRPEYLLTDNGSSIAPICQSLIEELDMLDIEKIALNKWSLPVLSAICQGDMRFSTLKKHFTSITPRALTQALKLLTSHHLVERVVDAEQYPPLVEYHLAPQCRNLCSILEKLVEELNAQS